MKKVFKFLGAVIAMLFLALLVFFYINTRDRHPGYSVDLNIKNETPGDIMVGFAAVKITPQIHDHWVDANNDAKYKPEDGDTFEDLNGNGKFDPIWIAGFSSKRAANGVHDDLWARTVVFDDGKTRLSLTSIDAIGFMHDEVVDVREFINAESGITYSVVSSTHTHEAPDLLGLWGESYLKSGVNPEYMDYLKRQTALSIDQAASSLQKASLKYAINENDALSVVMDTRKPYVYDAGLRMIQAVSLESGETLGTLVAWADHPETLWSKNLDITSDFPHFIREGMEKGVYSGDSLIIAGKGGISVYFNGAVGGLMTTHPSLEVKDHFSHEAFKEPGFDKAKAQGDYLAFLALSALDSSNHVVDKAGISLRAKSITVAFQNPYFRLGALLGVLNRGMTGWMKARSEMAAFSIGPAHFVTVPGEIYPEIVNGGVEAPEGQDFVIQPQEVPFIRAQMKGEINFLFGMANDMVGYIIPKSQWDEEAPFTYGENDAPYGEVNSLGPETAPKVHSEASALLDELYK
jgi:hypothetical protein